MGWAKEGNDLLRPTGTRSRPCDGGGGGEEEDTKLLKLDLELLCWIRSDPGDL